MFTPEEIEARSFVMVRRGYDPDEVGAFLRAAADDMRRMQDEVGAAKRKADPLDDAMADAVAIVQAARESAARIDIQAEERAAERLRHLEDDVARRLERTRAEARVQLDEAREQAAAIIAEANARKALVDADIASARNTWLRESAELEALSRRRRTVLEEAQDSLEQWMSALRDIVVEARAAQPPAPLTDEPVYPVESDVVDVPHQEQHDEQHAAETHADGHHEEQHADAVHHYEGA